MAARCTTEHQSLKVAFIIHIRILNAPKSIKPPDKRFPALMSSSSDGGVQFHQTTTRIGRFGIIPKLGNLTDAFNRLREIRTNGNASATQSGSRTDKESLVDILDLRFLLLRLDVSHAATLKRTCGNKTNRTVARQAFACPDPIPPPGHQNRQHQTVTRVLDPIGFVYCYANIPINAHVHATDRRGPDLKFLSAPIQHTRHFNLFRIKRKRQQIGRT